MFGTKLLSRLGYRACSTLCRHASPKPKPNRQLLPADVIPKHYKLFLDPDLKSFSYNGEVEISLQSKQKTKKITLNSVDLEIHSVFLGRSTPIKTTQNTEDQQITFEFEENIKENSTLKITFSGILNDKLRGFYRSVHKDSNGKEHIVATTQMEPCDCRRAFPCFDEPALKATFEISVAAEHQMTVLSNGKALTATDLPKSRKRVIKFETTPKMSTYLVAIVVGELKCVESNKFRVPVKVYATPGMEERCRYSADLAAETLKFFEDKFNIQYPLSKLDMVGIADFSAGAMENWGLITFRLADLFYTEGVDSVFSKCRVTEVVQHELAHQWFGNLVTMDWWDGLWLNEGFATWMSWYAGNAFNPEWKVWETYVQQTYSASLRRDSVRSSHPIEVPISKAQEVDEIFDAISYNKGSCVIKMISQLIGEETFIKGVSLYLKKHQYSNTTTTDLWDALSEVSGKDVAKFMAPWVEEVGYPLITVADDDINSGKIKVTQNRFLSTFDAKENEDRILWPIDLAVRRSDGTIDHNQLLTERSGVFDIGTSTDSKFFKLNADQTGIFRVKYPGSMLETIALEGAKGENSRLSVEDKIGIINDLNSLLGHEINTSQIMAIAEKWKNDASPNVLLSLLSVLSTISRQLFFQPFMVKDTFNDVIKTIIVPMADKYGQKIEEGENVLLTELKATLFNMCRQANSEKYIDLALNMFKRHGFKITPDFADAIYMSVAEHGSVDQWYELLHHYETSDNIMSGHSALFALGRTRDIDLQKEILLKILTQDIRLQDASTAFQGLMTASPKSALLGWTWLTNNYRLISNVFPSTNAMLGRLVSIAITSINEAEHIKRVELFFGDKDLTGIERVYHSSLDTLKASTSTIKNIVADVKNFTR